MNGYPLSLDLSVIYSVFSTYEIPKYNHKYYLQWIVVLTNEYIRQLRTEIK